MKYINKNKLIFRLHPTHVPMGAFYAPSYKNGKEDGLYRSWHPNGNLIYEINYKNGKFHGLYRYWFDNGKQWLEENYRNGKRHGTYHYWNYKNGKIK